MRGFGAQYNMASELFHSVEHLCTACYVSVSSVAKHFTTECTEAIRLRGFFEGDVDGNVAAGGDCQAAQPALEARLL